MAVRILVRTAWRFVRPVGSGVLTKPKPGETPEEAAQRVARDNSERLRRASHHMKEHFFDVKPGEVAEAPDWIKETEEWRMGRADGSIEELVGRSAAGAMPDVAAAAGETLVDEDEEEDEDEQQSLPLDEPEENAPPGATRRTLVGKKNGKKKGGEKIE